MLQLRAEIMLLALAIPLFLAACASTAQPDISTYKNPDLKQTSRPLPCVLDIRQISQQAWKTRLADCRWHISRLLVHKLSACTQEFGDADIPPAGAASQTCRVGHRPTAEAASRGVVLAEPHNSHAVLSTACRATLSMHICCS